jgi:hypothetical protein
MKGLKREDGLSPHADILFAQVASFLIAVAAGGLSGE